MRFTTPDIAWHNIKPIFSVDFHESGRLATAGADNAINIWRVESDGSVTFLSQLLKHSKPVNAIKFSPDGRFLASTGDDGDVYIWKLDNTVRHVQGMGEAPSENVEDWVITTRLARGGNDLYALDWSRDSTQLIVGAFDGVVYLWHLTRQYGSRYHELKDHWTLIQGVCYDPLNSMFVTQSADRSVRIYKKSKKGHKLYCAHHLKSRVTDVELENAPPAKTLLGDVVPEEEGQNRYFHHKYFHDDSAPTFFRRPGWSPEGQLLLLPCGQQFDSPDQLTPTNVTWLFARNNLARPLLSIPSKEISVAAKFSPVLYASIFSPSVSSSIVSSSSAMDVESSSAMTGSETSSVSAGGGTNVKLFDVDYRMVFAIATLDTIAIYDTEHVHPIAMFKDGHYDRMTDMAWNPSGTCLAVSNTDGYVSLLHFSDDELGPRLEQSRYDEVMKPALDAKIPKPKVPRKPKASAAATTDVVEKKEGESTVQENVANPMDTSNAEEEEDDEESDSDLEASDVLEGSIINFNEPSAAVNVGTSSAQNTPIVRKAGRRVVPTIVSSDSSTATSSTEMHSASDEKSSGSSSSKMEGIEETQV